MVVESLLLYVSYSSLEGPDWWYYSIAPRIPPGRVEGQESSKADVSKEQVVVVVVAVAVIYRCSFIASAFL